MAELLMTYLLTFGPFFLIAYVVFHLLIGAAYRIFGHG